jgi:Na+-transporting NADH:ubiquinone oxidoreductase subunit NqrF
MGMGTCQPCKCVVQKEKSEEIVSTKEAHYKKKNNSETPGYALIFY